MPTAAFDRPNRLKAREEGTIKWGELLEKFKSVQEKARRAHQSHDRVEDGTSVANESSKEKALPEVPKQSFRPASAAGIAQKQPQPAPAPAPLHRPKAALGNLGRLARGVGDRNKGKK